MPKNRTENNPFRHIRTEGTHYAEEIRLESWRLARPVRGLLHLFGCGESVFRPGAEIPIEHPYWAVQWITEGGGVLHCGGGRFRLRKGDVFLASPDSPYTFRLSQKDFLKKKYLLFDHGPLMSLVGNQEALRRQDILHPAEQERIAGIFDRIQQTVSVRTPCQSVELSNLGYALFAELASQMGRDGKKGEFEMILEEIMSHLGAGYSLDSLAGQFHVGKRTLNRLFQHQLDCSPGRLILDRRLQLGMGLLAGSDQSIAEIAEKCGFRNSKTFSRFIRRATGFSAREFRLGKQQAGTLSPASPLPAAEEPSEHSDGGAWRAQLPR